MSKQARTPIDPARALVAGAALLLLATAAVPALAGPRRDSPRPEYGAAAGPDASASGRRRPLILEGSNASSRLRVRARGRRFVVISSPGGVGELGVRCVALGPNAQRCRTGNISYIGLRGFGGKDRIKATDGVRTRLAILGGKGRDVIVGGAATDGLDGGAGGDRVLGGSGGDLLRGGAGNDQLAGGAGNDTVNGGPGRDLCGGGAGADLITFCP